MLDHPFINGPIAIPKTFDKQILMKVPELPIHRLMKNKKPIMPNCLKNLKEEPSEYYNENYI